MEPSARRVDIHELPPAVAQLRGIFAVADDDAGRGIGKQAAEVALRLNRIQGKEGTAGLHGRQQGDDLAHGTRQADSDRDFAFDAKRLKAPSKSLGATVELGVGDAFAVIPSFAGVVINDWNGWEKLSPKPWPHSQVG